MNSTIRCCRDCTERHTNCHDSCEIYLEQKAEWNIIREKLRSEATLDYEINSNRFKWIDKKRKRGKK